MSGAAELLAFCDARGVRLAALPGGRLDIDAPRAALTPDLLARLREHKPDLLALLTDGPGNGPQDLPGDDEPGDSYEREERAAIMEYDGGLSRPEAERAALLIGGPLTAPAPGGNPQDWPDADDHGGPTDENGNRHS